MNHRLSRCGLFVVHAILLTRLLSPCVGQEIGFIEDFALADDRTEALKQLVPGTEAYYYFHCLHYQNTQQYDQVEAMLKSWIDRLGETQLVTQIRNRQALLTYANDPQSTMDYLQRKLGLRFDHQRRLPSAERGLPSRLDPDRISYQTLYRRAVARHRNTDGFESTALHRLAQEEISPEQRRHLLQRLAVA